VTVSIPTSADVGDEVEICAVIAKQRVAACSRLPVRQCVVGGMIAPLRLEAHCGYYMTPAITYDGTLYCPRNNDVCVFSMSGLPLPSIKQTFLGLSGCTWAAAFDYASDTLLLAYRTSISDKNSQLVALDENHKTMRWIVPLEGSCVSIAVLSEQSLVVVGDFTNKELIVIRLTDGGVVCRTAFDRSVFSMATYKNTVFVSGILSVAAFHWDGSALVSEGEVIARDEFWSALFVAVMPPAPGQRCSYLVAGTRNNRQPSLRVFLLPDLRLIHTHALSLVEGVNMAGLATDPSGTALAVCDKGSQIVRVLVWPLPGMPPLQ
jgi:hypothetical protein